MDRRKHYAISLLSELNTFQKDILFCDGIIKIEEKQFFIHKAILSAASPYFRALFCNEWKETSSQEIQLQGVSSECFGILLDYIYTGSIDITSSNVEQLLPAGRLFQLDNIVEYCCEFLTSHLTVGNSLGILAFAKLHSCSSLVDTSLNYVHRHFEEVCKTEEFLEVDSSVLLSFLESDSIKISSEDDVFIALLRWTTYDIKGRFENFEHLLNHVKLPLVSPTIAEQHCSLYQDHDAAKMLYCAYSICLQEQKCSKNSSCPRTYSKKYFYVIGGLVQRHENTLIDPISVADVKRCEVPLQSDNENPALEYKFAWTTNIEPMNLPRSNVTVTSLNGLLYACGGEDELLVYDSVECYNPIANCWTPRAPMLSPRTSHGACAVNGEIYVAGGLIGDEISTTIEKYNPDKNTWTSVGTIPTPTFDGGVCEVNGLIYIIGGIGMEADMHRVVDCYDPVMERWCSRSPMLHKRAYAPVVGCGNYIYAIGGVKDSDPYNEIGGSEEDSVERYDIQKNQWEEVARLPFPRRNQCAVYVDNYIYVFGGTKGHEYVDQIDCYDVVQNKWSNAGQLNSKLSHAAAVVF